MKRSVATFAAGLALAAAGGAARGQVEQQAQLDRFDRQLEQIQRDSRVRADLSIPPADRATFDYGGYLTYSLLLVDDQAAESHVLRRAELVGYARLNLDGAHEFYARGRTVYDDYNRGDSFDGRGDDWESPYLERFHYRFDLQRSLAAYNGTAIDWNVVLQGGRQLVTWGNGLTLSEVVDGGIASAKYGPFTLDAVAGVTYDDVVDFDLSRPDFRNDTHRGLFGGMLGFEPKAGQRVYAYGLVQRDYNGAEKSGAGGVTTRFDYNSYYLGLGASGSVSDDLLYAVELVYEGGNTLSNSRDPAGGGSQLAQSKDDINAVAFDGRLDYLFADRGRSRLSGEVILATGDRDRTVTSSTLGGNRAGTDDHAFNAFGLLNTGLAFAPAVSNLAVVRVGASTFPVPEGPAWAKQLQVGADVLVFGKFYQDAPLDEPTSNDRYIGTEADFYLNWQVTSDVTLAVRYGLFAPGAGIDGESDARQFFFAGLTYAF
jgi:hypothetical protein